MLQGDACPYSHSEYESLYHPHRFRTQWCKDPKNAVFHRKRLVCCFAHNENEIRTVSWRTIIAEKRYAVSPTLYSQIGYEIAVCVILLVCLSVAEHNHLDLAVVLAIAG